MFKLTKGSQFQFDGTIERSGRFGITIIPLDLERIKKGCEEAKKLHVEEPFSGYDLADSCLSMIDNSFDHTQECLDSRERCIAKIAEIARKRLDILIPLHHLLTKCAEFPPFANGLRTLEILAQESLVYETSPRSVPQR